VSAKLSAFPAPGVTSQSPVLGNPCHRLVFVEKRGPGLGQQGRAIRIEQQVNH
jgi:hypothetical protein